MESGNEVKGNVKHCIVTINSFNNEAGHSEYTRVRLNLSERRQLPRATIDAKKQNELMGCQAEVDSIYAAVSTLDKTMRVITLAASPVTST